ncbi:MAG: hypothetical protein ACYDG4_15100 [Desulfuromonadaceae bacterium]
MQREKGTLTNFLGDGAITINGLRWALRTGKLPIGQERTQIIPRTQLAAWGILQGA